MWTREYIKTKAKQVLKVSYWQAFLVSIILVIFGAEDTGFSYNNRMHSNRGYSGNPYEIVAGNIENWFPFVAAGIVVLVIVLLAFMFRVMLGYPIEVGGRRFFVKAAGYEVDTGNLGYGFKAENYWDIVKTMLLRAVYNFLWFLLLVIPGIIKAYAYSMVPYILADNPNIGAERAIELSNQMTEGHKFDMFVLELSFIGWYLLGALLFFVGVFFVIPYESATKAELYLILRQNAIDNGYSSYEELNMI